MERQHILETFGTWVTFLFQALPGKLRPSMFELLIGCIVSRSGHLSEALLAVRIHRFWNTYYKVITEGVFSWLAISRQWIVLLLRVLQPQEILLAIDDTCVPRSSRKAPAVAYHHNHAKKPNRPSFLWGQLSVFLALICVTPYKSAAVPLLQRLIPKRGNRSKLQAGLLLIRLFTRWVGDTPPVRLLLDAWYMKGPLLRGVLACGISVIGQVRRDTVCYGFPKKKETPRRGRPPKYGQKCTFSWVEHTLTLQEGTILAYGQHQRCQFYSFTARVRFLQGRVCRMVWCRLQPENGSWTKWCLLLSTAADLSPERIIKLYTLRWWIEPMFKELKHRCGLSETWQQSKQALARWSFMVLLSHGLNKLLALCFSPDTLKKLHPIPWRMGQPMTAGWVSHALGTVFRNVRVRPFWDRKCQKIRYPEEFLETPLKNSA